MSAGHFNRSHLRSRNARRRAALYASSSLARRGGSLPPHLLPGMAKRKQKPSSTVKRLVILGGVLTMVGLLFFVVTFAIATVAGVVGTVHAYHSVNDSLPSAASIELSTYQTTTITDRNGVVLQQVDQPEGGWRTFVPLTSVSQYLIDATVSAEDSTFWTNYGVEPVAIVRGASIIFSGAGSSGGSTITQQLARGLYKTQIGDSYSLTRKFREAMAAIALTKEYSKEDILTMYLNEIFYGQRSYGIEAAANTYFNKHAKDLTLGEASLLAGLPQAPSYYDPTVNFPVAKKRQLYVLNQMVKYGYIDQAQADAAFKEPLNPGTRSGAVTHAPHFTQYVRNYIEQHWPGALYSGGLTIETSLDLNLQAEAEQIVQSRKDFLLEYQRNNAAMVVMVPWSGQVLAMVGSMDFNDPYIGGQNNYATSLLQPGSSIKPVVYAAAFESGWNPGTVIMDGHFSKPYYPGSTQVYEPNNYSGNYYGAVSVRVALSNSLNIPAVKALEFAGGDHVEAVGRRMGYTSASLPDHFETYGDGMALGSGEVTLLDHTNVYATLANEGKFVAVNPILKITDSQGNVLYDVNRDKPWEQGTQAIKAAYAYQLTSILTDNDSRSMIFGENNLFGNTMTDLGRPTAAKSGTTDSWKDIWTMGYTTDVAIGVWTGNTVADGTGPTALPAWDGIQGAGPIWQAMIETIHQPQWSSLLVGPDGQPMPKDFAVPPDIVHGSVCVSTGNAAEDGYQSRDELLVAGEGPSLPCDQLSAYQLSELKNALKDIDVNGDRYVNGGISKVERYAKATGYSSGSSGGSANAQGDGSIASGAGNGSTKIIPANGNGSGN